MSKSRSCVLVDGCSAGLALLLLAGRRVRGVMVLASSPAGRGARVLGLFVVNLLIQYGKCPGSKLRFVWQVGDKQGGGSRVLVQWSGVKRGHFVLLDGGWKGAVDVACQSEAEVNGWKEGRLTDLATVCLSLAAERIPRLEELCWRVWPHASEG